MGRDGTTEREGLYAGRGRALADRAGRDLLHTVYCTGAAAASIQAEAERRFPGEGCGLLGGRQDGPAATIAAFVPVCNRDGRPDRFAIDAADFAEAEAELRRRGLCWLGFAHGHPTGDAALSAIDRGSLWHSCLQVIVPVRSGVAGIALAHWLDAFGTARTLPLRVLP